MKLSSKICFLFVIACIFEISFGQSIHGTVSGNPAGGQDATLVAGHQIGKPDHNLGAGVFASGNSKTGEGAHGGFVNYNIRDHGLSLSKSITPNSDTFSQNARVNLFNDQIHRVDTNLQHSHTKLNNGFDFDKYRGSLDYNHAAGHAASIGVGRIPKIDTTTLDLMGKANIWTSADRATTLDATATASRNLGGPFHGQTNYGAGIGLTHRFGAFGRRR